MEEESGEPAGEARVSQPEHSKDKLKRVGKNDNIVFVGKKPTMSYVLL